MKWVYILIMIAISAFTLGCVDKSQAETTIANPDQTPVSPGGSPVTQATPSEVTQIPAPGEDIFGTYSDLAEMNNMSSDMDMQIVLSNEI
ncbi:MAG TPA: hypothetical protein VF360_06075 [Candidatus Methanoperedens sp.]|jgi:hypothetical protein